MTPHEFQINHSGELKKFFETPVGREFLTILNGLRPQLSGSFPTEHEMLRSYAKVEGFELCLRNIVGLIMLPKITPQPEANYGVPDRKPEEDKK